MAVSSSSALVSTLASKASLQGLEQQIEQLDLDLSHTEKDDEELWN